MVAYSCFGILCRLRRDGAISGQRSIWGKWNKLKGENELDVGDSTFSWPLVWASRSLSSWIFAIRTPLIPYYTPYELCKQQTTCGPKPLGPAPFILITLHNSVSHPFLKSNNNNNLGPSSWVMHHFTWPHPLCFVTPPPYICLILDFCYFSYFLSCHTFFVHILSHEKT